MFIKPTVKIIGEDGNVFNLIGITNRALNRSHQPELAKEFQIKALQCASYDAVLQLITKYCEVE